MKSSYLDKIMENRSPKHSHSWLEVFSATASGLAVVVGGLVLAGWTWDVDPLKRILPGLVSMNPLTAVSFLLAGVSLWLQRGPPPNTTRSSPISARHCAQICALLVLCLGLLKLTTYAFGWEFGLDQGLFAEKLRHDAPSFPNRMSPNTALGFIFIGLALLLLDVTTRRGQRPAEFFAVPAALISLLALFGYAYQVQWLYGVAAFIPMALHTAAAFQLLALGILCARRDAGLMSLLTSDSPGGVMARRLFPGMVLILFVLGWLRLEGERRGLYGAELGVALHTSANITLFGALIWWSARSLHRADVARKRTEAQCDRFFTRSLDLLCIAGTDGYFKRLNLAFHQTLGYTTEELMACPFLDFVHPDDRAAARAELEKLGRGVPTLQQENRYQCKDGSWKWLSWRVQPFPGEGLLYATARDVTERRQMEAALEHERHLLHMLMDNVPADIYFKDRQSRFLRNNRAHARRFGVDDPTQVVGKTDFDFFSAEHATQAYEDEQQVIRTGQPINKEEKETWPDGRVTWALTTKLPLRDEIGRIVGTFGISHGITERKQAEATIQRLNSELRQRAVQLEEANKELEAFSYSVSHDLRAPLRHVQGYVEMLQRAVEGQLSDKARRYLKIITDASVEMGQLIDDLLDFSRMGRTELHETCGSLDGFVQETIKGLEMVTRGRNINWEIPPLPQVMGDPAMLKQALANLIGNAVKYTRQRDPAEITIGCAGEEDGRVIFFVRDNGAGFDMQYAHKLFGVFQRLHRADEFEGTGIGLATVRRVIARHGGRTWAEGKVGAGATFYFTLKPATKV